MAFIAEVEQKYEDVVTASKNGCLNDVIRLAINDEKKKEALKSAVIYGHFEVVKYLVESGVDVTYNDNYAVLLASEHGHIDIVKYLADHGAVVEGDMAICWALRPNGLNMVKYIVENFDIDIKGKNHALEVASDRGYLEIIMFLVENGAEIAVNDNYPVRTASCNGHLDTVKYLVEKGADITVHENEAICWASECDHLEVVKYLVEKGADINKAFISAVKEKKNIIVKYLVEQGADVTVNKNFAVQRFCLRNDLDMVKCIVNAGGEILSFKNYLINTAIKHNNSEMIQYFIEKGIPKKLVLSIVTRKGYLQILKDITQGDEEYLDHIVETASQYGHLEVIKYAVEKGGSVTSHNNHAVRIASRHNHREVVEYLAEKGADITSVDNYPVRKASENGHLELVKYLVEKGANITAKDNYAVQHASENGYLDVVKYLVEEHKADVTAKDNYAVRYASRRGHFDVVRYLVGKGANIHANNDEALRMAKLGNYTKIVEYITGYEKFKPTPTHLLNKILKLPEDDRTCVICTEVINSDLYIVECGHMYHCNCLSRCKQCPMCRAQL